MRHISPLILTTAITSCLASMPAFAQSEKEAGKDDDTITLEQVSVVGSQIKGANSSALLPIETLSAEKIESIGAVSGDDLYRNIPQMGDGPASLS